MASPRIYALDFDGVICDSAIETAMTGWKVAGQIWSNMPDETPQEIIALFRKVRPVMETGYEAILIMRALFEGVSTEHLLNKFSSQLAHLIHRDQLNTDKLKQRFGDTRDQWIKHDLKDWMAMNPLFDGFANKLQQIDPTKTYIITTKQERFVSQILLAIILSFLPNEFMVWIESSANNKY